MKSIKLLAFCLSVISTVGCGDMNRNNAPLFAIELDGNEFKKNDSVTVSIKNNDQKTIQNIRYSIDGKDLSIANEQLVFNTQQLGNKILKVAVTYDGGVEEISKNVRILAANPPEVYKYEIINEFPHDTTAFTQGLEFHKGILYESTGKRGRSSLRKVDFKTGKVEQQVEMDQSIFGEGLSIMNNKIFMLTWQSKTGFIYNVDDLSKLDNFQYGESKEGWGLTNNGKQLIKSDGTEKIWFLNPETLVEEGYIQTATNTSLKKSANELEYVNGKIYANVYQFPSVMIIDANSGAIEGVVNFSGLADKVTKKADWNDKENVLNGIAYHPERKTFFVTGKEWNKLFEVNIVKN